MSDQTATESTSVAVPETSTELRSWGVDPALDFQKLALEAKYFSRGFRLVSDKGMLVGVPHVIIGVTYRPGYSRPDGVTYDYVSIEAVVADKKTLNSNPIRSQLPCAVEDLPVFANESIVYNDGGTGIRRELTSIFHSQGLIDVGTPKKNENPFDRPFQQWASGADIAQEGIFEDSQHDPFRFVAVRGLRRSDYESPFGPATTFYIG